MSLLLDQILFRGTHSATREPRDEVSVSAGTSICIFKTVKGYIH